MNRRVEWSSPRGTGKSLRAARLQWSRCLGLLYRAALRSEIWKAGLLRQTGGLKLLA